MAPIARGVRLVLARACLAAAISHGSGCLGPTRPTASPPLRPLADASAKQVKTGGACLDLGEDHQAAYTVDEFVAKTAELLVANRNASARNFVGLYPDLCQEALRRAGNTEASAAAIQLIAKVHDRQTGLAGTPLSWADLMQERVSNPGRFAAYDTVRRRAADLLREGKTGDAVTALAKSVPHPLLEIDAHRLAGETMLKAEQPGRAATEFTAALKLTQASYAYQTAQLELLLGEAKRQSGDSAQGVGVWQQAVVTAGQLNGDAVVLTDPILWETASALRPVNGAWPDPVVDGVMPAGAVRRTPGADEAWLWKRVGQWRLDRGEPQAALLAFKRAESMAAEPALQEDLQLLQASALAQLGQPAAAAAILTPLVDKPRATVSAAALATLGAMKLQTGAGPQAVKLLQAALSIGQSADWSGRADAEADFGLACLLIGDEAAGLENLHAAQERFATAGNVFMLRQCLENEAAYFKRSGKAAEESRVRARLEAMEQGARGPA